MAGEGWPGGDTWIVRSLMQGSHTPLTVASNWPGEGGVATPAKTA